MNGSNWQYATVGVLLGFGAGYAIGTLTARWLWLSQHGTIVSAIRELREEVSCLSTVVQTEFAREHVRSVSRSEEGASEYVSAEEEEDENDSETEKSSFLELLPANGVRDKYASLDEISRQSEVSKEVCVSLYQALGDDLKKNSNDVGLLWRIARCLVHLSVHHKEDGAQEKAYLQQATEFAQKGISLDNKVWQAHHWFAVGLGSQVKYESIQQKIAIGHQYKDSIDTALRLSPQESILHYLQGRWCYEAAGLSWIQKKAAAALCGAPPQSTYKEALQYFSTAGQLCTKPWKANLLMIAKCHLMLGQQVEAMQNLQQAEQLVTVSLEDQDAEKEIKELLQKHGHLQ